VPKALRLSRLNRVPVGVTAHGIHGGAEASSSLFAAAIADDLSRNVFGLLGIPVDAIDFVGLLGSIESAAGTISPFLISTPNVNFLIKSHGNSQFRESLLMSNLCLADGMPLIWLAKILRIPICERIAGSDLFGRLKSTNNPMRRLRVFLVGGAEGVAATVGAKLNSERSGLECVGVINPGFGTIEEMSSPEIIETINASQADLIAVFFGAEKAQAWLMLNHHLLRAPLRAQFGATINFEAGTVRRAPRFIRSTGFEWLWRIKEEPYLWRRYWNDGTVLLKLMVTSVLPLAFDAHRRRVVCSDLSIDAKQDTDTYIIELSGNAVHRYVNRAIDPFRLALASGKQVAVDISKIRDIDARFFGLLLMVRKHLANQGRRLVFTGVSNETRRIFRLNKFEFLLSC
jgi:N-acetylglucosaminyldiphosphoundecaprenol N-acetyl-beta-D-mannosaminyltransferase